MKKMIIKLFIFILGIIHIYNLSAFESQISTKRYFLAPLSSIKPIFLKSDMDIAVKRMEVAMRRKLSETEFLELKQIIEWIKQLRATIFSDSMLKPLQNEEYSFYLKRMNIAFMQFKNNDLSSNLDIKFNPNIEDNGWTLQISFRQTPIFSFTYLNSLKINLNDETFTEKISEEFKDKPFFICKTIWDKNPIIINGKYFPKKIITKSGYVANGISIDDSNNLWINPFGHLDEHYLDIEFMESALNLFGNEYIMQPLSERVHISQKQEIDILERRKNLTPYKKGGNSIVIGDLHSDKNGLLNILSFLKQFIIIKKDITFSWADKNSYDFDLESLKYAFPNGFKIIQVGDIIGPLAANEDDPFLIYKILFALQDKFIELNKKSKIPYEFDLIAGNYEIASALHSEEASNKGFMVQVEGGKLKYVYKTRIKKFMQGKHDEFNSVLFESLWELKRFKAAAIVDDRLVVHGGISNELLSAIIEKYFLDNPDEISKYFKTEEKQLDYKSIFIPESYEMLLKNNGDIKEDKLYLEDLRDIINNAFYELFDKEKNGGIFSKINIKSKWGMLFFDFNDVSKIGSIVESRPSHFDKDSYLILSQIVAHSPEQFFNAPILESFNGRYLNIDTDISKQQQSNFLYINQSGYHQVTFGSTKEKNHTLLYDGALVLKPKNKNLDNDSLISINLESYNKLKIKLLPYENTAQDITAILAANGLAIEKMFVDFNTFSDSGKVIYDITFEVLRTEKTESSSKEEFFEEVQKDIADSLKYLQKLREKNKNTSQSRIYWELFLKGKLQNTGVLRSYFSRISDKKTEIQQYDEMDNNIKRELDSIYAKNTFLKNYSFFRVLTSERFGLLHVLFRILEEEEGFKIHRVDAKTYLSDDNNATIADDFIFISHKDNSPLKKEEYNRIKKKLETFLDFNKIDGRSLGLPSKGFEIETIIQNIDLGYLELKRLKLINSAV